MDVGEHHSRRSGLHPRMFPYFMLLKSMPCSKTNGSPLLSRKNGTANGGKKSSLFTVSKLLRAIDVTVASPLLLRIRESTVCLVLSGGLHKPDLMPEIAGIFDR
jgi:hypothetical protein